MNIFDRVKYLADRQGKSLQKVSEDLNFSSNYLYRLKTQSPTAEKISLIADYFHVSVDYLLGKQEEKTIVTSLQDFISGLENNIENEEQNHDRFIRFFKALSVSFTEADFANLTDIISGYSLLTEVDRKFFTDVIGMRAGILNESFAVKEGEICIIPNEEG